MPTIPHSLFRNDAGANITVFYDGEVYTATDSHPNWDAIVAGVNNGDAAAVDLFDIANTAQARFLAVSERVSVSNGRVYFDGSEVASALTNQIVRFIAEGLDFTPLVSFFEKVETNPNEHSREQLYRWLDAHQFTITADGDFVAYKGVRVNNGEYTSISKGTAVSDGIEYNGAIPNPVGAVVTMPRTNVQHDPSVGCHTGLHAGTWDYASNFAQGAVLQVRINPRDVVSVPSDCNSQKLRVCRYVVEKVIDAPVESALDEDYSDEYDDDEDEVLETSVIDTKLNHTRQVRDQYGRFIRS